MHDNYGWAIHEGKWFNIEEVDDGLDCNCYCPVCETRMIAKKGDIKRHHFAHYSLENCNYSNETALHMMAKDIIKNSTSITIPPIHINDGVIVEMNVPEKNILHKESNVVIIETECEKRLVVNDTEYIVPDVLIKTENEQFIIEILVSHKVDWNKKKLIKELHISTLEIDLSSVGNVVYEELKQIILDEIKNKKWIYNQKASDFLKEISVPTHCYKDIMSSGICKRTGEKQYSCDCYTDCPEYYCGDTVGGILFCSYPKQFILS